MSFNFMALIVVGAGSILTIQTSCLASTMSGMALDSQDDLNIPISQPPIGFNATTASAVQLEAFGFPPRPSGSASQSVVNSWSTAVSAGRRVSAKMEPFDSGHHLESFPNNLGPTAGSYSWSGGVLHSPVTSLGSGSMIGVSGTIMVPVAQTAFNVCSATPVSASEWVGIDGLGSSDIVQAGVETDAVCKSGVVTPTYYVWFEWFPSGAYKISNFPVSSGDAIYINVSLRTASTALVYMSNETTNVYTSAAVAIPKGSTFVGNSAEWIIERPNTANGPSILTNYVSAFIGQATTTLNDGKGTTIQPVNSFSQFSLSAYYMYDNYKGMISAPEVLAPDGFMFSDLGSAR